MVPYVNFFYEEDIEDGPLPLIPQKWNDVGPEGTETNCFAPFLFAHFCFPPTLKEPN